MFKITVEDETGNKRVIENVVAFDTWDLNEVKICIDRYVKEHDNLEVEVNEENIKKVAEKTLIFAFGEDEYPSSDEDFYILVKDAIEELNI